MISKQESDFRFGEFALFCHIHIAFKTFDVALNTYQQKSEVHKT